MHDILCLSLCWRHMIQWQLKHVKVHLPAHVTLWIMNQKTAKHTATFHLMPSAWWAYAK